MLTRKILVNIGENIKQIYFVIFSLIIILDNIIKGNSVGNTVLNHSSNPVLAPFRLGIGNINIKIKRLTTSIGTNNDCKVRDLFLDIFF
jgi:hypothetical protein